MALRRIFAAAAATGAAAKFASWESHGELMDQEVLKQKATSQELRVGNPLGWGNTCAKSYKLVYDKQRNLFKWGYKATIITGGHHPVGNVSNEEV